MRCILVLVTLSLSASAYAILGTSKRYARHTENGIHLPIYRRVPLIRKRGTKAGSIGLGDFLDVTYNVLVTVGGVSTPVVLDTGSSDLWVMSDACTTCPSGIPLYPQATFQSVGLDVRLLYGDSRTGTHAFGLIGKDTVDLAGLTLQNQYFAAINDTNTSIAETGSAGIFGLGFPVNSVIWTSVLIKERANPSNFSHREISEDRDPANLGRLTFPNISGLFRPSRYPARQTSSFVDSVFNSYSRTGPLLSRLIASQELTMPMFTITLQRDTVDVGGNVGMLSIGELPNGINNDSLTWVPLRTYTISEGGLPPPADSPGEEYPITWEVFVDDVYLDGVKLPRSTLSPPNIALSALIDTGNSLLRGPADVVQFILTKLGTRFDCSEPHSLAFQIGGQMFPVDPRDFVNQAFTDSVSSCTPNLVPTDPPVEGRYLYSWSLGDPFLKSVLSSYHYGNLTYPSRDRPRMGFLSTVPADANDRLRAAVQAAAQNGGNFPALSETAPTGVPTAVHTNTNGVPEAKPTTVTTSGALPSNMMSWLMSSIIMLVSGSMFI